MYTGMTAESPSMTHLHLPEELPQVLRAALEFLLLLHHSWLDSVPAFDILQGR